MAKEYDSDIVLNDLENFLFDSFNLFIKGAVKGLSKDEAEGGGSPVHTGYFASSWTAGYNRPKREPYEVSDQNRKGLGGVDGSEEWGSAYWRNLELKNDARSAAGVPKADSSCPPFTRGTVVPRYLKGVLSREFDFRRKVYIGNRAYYRAYALEGGAVQRYVQGTLAQKVKQVFQENRRFGDVTDMLDLAVSDRPLGKSGAVSYSSLIPGEPES